MDTAQFLARLVPPGYIAIGVNSKPGQKGGFWHRFFPEGQFADAASYLRWAAGKGWDAYHANASFKVAEADGQDNRGKPKYKGLREQNNVQSLKAFWIDIDVKRAGDKKAAGAAYATQGDGIAWLAGFIRTIGLPRPNMVVNSGYGIHVYWILEDAMKPHEWQPYADALRAALVGNGFIGDAGISSDAARVLRPPGTNNCKVPGSPAPVLVSPKIQGGDIPNASILTALKPYLGLMPSKGPTTSAGPATGAASALGSGTVSPIFGATAPALQPNMAAAATANLPSYGARTRSFAQIAQTCVQVQTSLASHGNGDDYRLWYLGFISLAEHCADGRDFIHPISDGDPKYTIANVDAHAQQAHDEWVKKNVPPPSCSHFEKVRSGLCQTCPAFGKVNSPWDLGTDSGDLPDHYRRFRGYLQFEDRDKDGNPFWRNLMAGDFTEACLDWVAPLHAYTMTFRHTRAGHDVIVHVPHASVKPDRGAIFNLFGGQGVAIPSGMESHFREFILAWIDQLIDSRATRHETIKPFGWALKDGKPSGFALTGVLHRPDGRVEAAPGADGVLLGWYTPQGDLAKWREAFDFLARGRADLQAIMAVAVASPLMQFTGQSGVCVSAFGGSGMGKSSALTVATGFWGSPSAKNYMHDTSNSVFGKLVQTRHLPCNWDEARIQGEEVRRFCDMVFTLTGGKEKSRMNSDITLRAVGEWKTILCVTSNHPLQDHMVEQEASEAGALRVFEFPVVAVPTQGDTKVSLLIAQAESHYGRAGAIYAQWLARNHQTAHKVVAAAAEGLNSQLGATQAERFYVAAMSTMLAGAKIANHLGLTSFDVPALRAFLCKTFFDLRAARAINVSMTGNGYDLTQIVGSYVYEQIGHKLVTDSFVTRSPKSRVPTISWQPAPGHPVEVHIANTDQLMRITRTSFYDWCRKRNLPGSVLLAQMKQKWGVVEDRFRLGSGTNYAGSQVWCLQFPLSHPDLQDFLTVQAPPTAVQPQKNTPTGVPPTVAQRMAGQVPPP
jgi:hypothetical protein